MEPLFCVGLTVLGVFIANAAIVVPMFFWLRTEANADRRDLANLLFEMKSEMKDFHFRLLKIEEARK